MNHAQLLQHASLWFDDNQFSKQKDLMHSRWAWACLSRLCNEHEFIASLKDVNETISMESWLDHNSIVWSWIIRVPRMQRKYSPECVLICECAVLAEVRWACDEIQVECKPITIWSWLLTFNKVNWNLNWHIVCAHMILEMRYIFIRLDASASEHMLEIAETHTGC